MNPELLAVASLLVSILMAVIAITSSVIAYNVFRASTDPSVIVFAAPDPRRPSIINLIVKNVGRGPACDIQFSSDKPLPEEAFGFEEAKLPSQMSKGPIVTGIGYLAPEQSFVMTWGQYGGLSKFFGDSVISVTAKYTNPAHSRRKLHSVSQLDILSFKWVDGSDNNWDKKSAEALKDINETLKKISRSLEDREP